jgi:hypothetical protein
VPVGAIAVAVVVLMSGCINISVPPIPTPTPSGSESGSPSSPPPSPPDPPVAAPLTCESLLDASTLAEFASHPDWGLTDPATFAAKLHTEGNPLAAFDDYGGILCQWGVMNSDVVDMYGYSPITPTQVADQQSALFSAGATVAAHGSGNLFRVNPDTEDEDYYYFGDGFWIWQHAESTLIDQILTHLPA